MIPTLVRRRPRRTPKAAQMRSHCVGNFQGDQLAAARPASETALAFAGAQIRELSLDHRAQGRVLLAMLRDQRRQNLKGSFESLFGDAFRLMNRCARSASLTLEKVFRCRLSMPRNLLTFGEMRACDSIAAPPT